MPIFPAELTPEQITLSVTHGTRMRYKKQPDLAVLTAIADLHSVFAFIARAGQITHYRDPGGRAWNCQPTPLALLACEIV